MNDPLIFMSSTAAVTTTGQATSSISIQLVIDALADYAKITGIDLSDAATLEQSNSLGDILQLIQDREKDFNEYRNGSRRLISCLSPTVKVLQAFSGIMGEAASLVSYSCNLVSFIT